MRAHVLTIDVEGNVERSDYVDLPATELTQEVCAEHATGSKAMSGMDHVHFVRGTAQSIVVEIAQDKPWTWRKVIYTAA